MGIKGKIKFRKYFALVIFSLIVIPGIDIINSQTIYRPLGRIYQLLSAWQCHSSSILSCTDELSLSEVVSGQKGMVVTAHELASQVGVEVLRQGGNAVDAAVAIGYALAVVHPCCGNLGGGGFMLIRLADGEEKLIDFRETAPKAFATQEVIAQVTRESHLAVGVPGTVRGLEWAREKYGTLTRQHLIAPAYQLAKQGFTLKTQDVEILQKARKKLRNPGMREIFRNKGQKSDQLGERLVQTNLASTLSQISEHGVEAFYQGRIAQELVAASQNHGGVLTQADLANYQIKERVPLHCSYRGYEVISAPLPGGGVTLCQMLNILEGYDLRRMSATERLKPLLSAMVYAFSDRNAWLGDPDFVENPVSQMLDKSYAEQIRQQINTQGKISPRTLVSPPPEGKQTTHYSVIDAQGNAVSVTYTLNSLFGAGVIGGNTGIILNNQLDDFTLTEGQGNQFGLVQGKANLIEPGKRPLSSMSPTILLKDGEVILITGSPGGPTIPTTVLQIILNLVDFQMDLPQAVNAPRIHYQGLPDVVITEPHYLPLKQVDSLWNQGYRIIPFPEWGAAESIRIDPKTNTYYGVNDSRRRMGKALAF